MRRYSDGFALINGQTAINFTELKSTGPCSKCGRNGETGYTHSCYFVKTAFNSKKRVDCGGKYLPGLKKRQGSRVKKYRKTLEQSGIKFIESMFINVCVCNVRFPYTCEPGQMTVVFSWE